jgi:hypothetical protein
MKSISAATLRIEELEVFPSDRVVGRLKLSLVSQAGRFNFRIASDRFTQADLPLPRVRASMSELAKISGQ